MVKWLACLALTGCELFVNVPNATLVVGDDDVTDGNQGCSESSTCSAPTPVCNTQSGTCVECLTSPDCTMPALPVCDTNVCRGCLVDSECPSSGVCLVDGTCADAARVAYASPAGTGAACTTTTPCTLDTAIAQVSATQDIVKLAAGTYERPVMASITKSTIITGEGAILHGAGGTAIVMLDVTGGVSLTVMSVDFQLNGDFGAECTGVGGALHLDRVKLIGGEAGAYVSACAFSLDRSTADGNTFYGFYLVGSTISITNSFITNNGAMSQGGFVFASGTVGTVEHVTLSGNAATTAGAHAMRCTTAGQPTIRSSIIYGNGTPSIDALCTVGYSVVDPDYTGGANNVSMDPLYVAPATHDYHIKTGSPAVGHADPASMLLFDVDGDPRPQPTGSVADSGADEIP